MRNFKRILALVLSVIMIVGTFATVSAASTDEVWYDDAVDALDGTGVSEIGETAADEVTRNEFVLWIAKIASGQPSNTAWLDKIASVNFTDVDETHYQAAIAYAWKYGYIEGNGDGTFAPDKTISLAEACAIIVRLMGYEDKITAMTGQWDMDYITIAHWYCEAIDDVFYRYTDTFNPDYQLCKGEAAYLLANITNLFVEDEDDYVLTADDINLGQGLNKNSVVTVKTEGYIVYKMDGKTVSAENADPFVESKLTTTGGLAAHPVSEINGKVILISVDGTKLVTVTAEAFLKALRVSLGLAAERDYFNTEEAEINPFDYIQEGMLVNLKSGKAFTETEEDPSEYGAAAFARRIANRTWNRNLQKYEYEYEVLEITNYKDITHIGANKAATVVDTFLRGNALLSSVTAENAATWVIDEDNYSEAVDVPDKPWTLYDNEQEKDMVLASAKINFNGKNYEYNYGSVLVKKEFVKISEANYSSDTAKSAVTSWHASHNAGDYIVTDMSAMDNGRFVLKYETKNDVTYRYTYEWYEVENNNGVLKCAILCTTEKMNNDIEDSDVEIYNANWGLLSLDEAMDQLINAAQGESFTVYYDTDGDGDVDSIFIRETAPFRVATNLNTATSQSYFTSVGATGSYSSKLPVGSVVIGATVKEGKNTKDTAYTIADTDNSAIQLVLVGSGKYAYDFDDIDVEDYATYNKVPAKYQDYYTVVDVATIQSGIITNAPVARYNEEGEVDYFVARIKLADETVVSAKIPALPLTADGQVDPNRNTDVTLPVTVNGITADWTFDTTVKAADGKTAFDWMSFISEAVSEGNIYETNDNDVTWENTAAWMAGKYVKFAVNADNEVVFIQSSEETGKLAILTGVTKTDKANIYKATIATYDSTSADTSTVFAEATMTDKNYRDIMGLPSSATINGSNVKIDEFTKTNVGVDNWTLGEYATTSLKKDAAADTADGKVIAALKEELDTDSANWDKYTKVEVKTDTRVETYLWIDAVATAEAQKTDPNAKLELRMIKQTFTEKTYKFTYPGLVLEIEMGEVVSKTTGDKTYSIVEKNGYIADFNGNNFVRTETTTNTYFIGNVDTVEVRASASGAFDYENTAIYNKIYMSGAVLDTFETNDSTIDLSTTGSEYSEINVVEDLIYVDYIKDSTTGFLVYKGVSNAGLELENALGITPYKSEEKTKEIKYKNDQGTELKKIYAYDKITVNTVEELNTQDEWITLGTSKEALAEADQKLNFLGGKREALDMYGNKITAASLAAMVVAEGNPTVTKPYKWAEAALEVTDETTLKDVYEALHEDSQEAFAKSIAGYETRYTAVLARNPVFARTYTAANGFTYSVQYKEVVHTDALVARVMHVVDAAQTLLVPVYNADASSATDFFVVTDEEDVAEQIGIGRYVDKDGRVFTYLPGNDGKIIITYKINNDGSYQTQPVDIKTSAFTASFNLEFAGVELDFEDTDAVRAYALANGYKDSTVYNPDTLVSTKTKAEAKFLADYAAFMATVAPEATATTKVYNNVPFANNVAYERVGIPYPVCDAKDENFDFLNQGETSTDSGEYKAIKPVANFEAKKLTKEDTNYFPGAYTVTIKNNVSESDTFNVTKDTLITVIAPKNGTAGIEITNTTAAALVEAKSSLFVTGWQTNEGDEYLGGLVLIAEWLTEDKPVEEIQEEYQIVYLNANAEAYIEFDNESLTWDLVSDMEAYDVLTAESVGVIRIQYNTVTEAEIAEVDLTLEGGKYYYIDEDNNVKGIVTDTTTFKGTGKITAAKLDGTVTAEKINSKDFNSYEIVFAYIDQTTGALTLASAATNVVVIDEARYVELVADAQEAYDEVEAEYDEKIELVEKKALSAAYVESIYGAKLAAAKEKLDTTLAGYMTKYVDGQFWGYYNSAVYNWFLKQSSYQNSKGLAFDYIAYEDTLVVFTDTFDFAA